MGRRVIGGVLVACGLMAASLAWTGYAVGRTVLDPGRSQAIAEDLYQNREVRIQLRSSMASALGAALPSTIRVRRSELVAAADRALDDPAVEAALIGGLIRSHQRFLGEDPIADEPIIIDAAAFPSASRAALISVRPDLADIIPEPPSVPIELPTDRLPDAGGFRTWLIGAIGVLTALAVGLVAAAFVLTNDRPRILRRVGFWGIGAGAVWLLIGVVLPELAHLVIPGPAAILAALWGVAAGGMITPARNVAVGGSAAVAISFLWVAVAALVGDRQVPRPARSTAQPLSPNPQQLIRHDVPAPIRHTASRSTPSSVSVSTSPPATPILPPPVLPLPTPPVTRWVEGLGYIDEADPTRSGDAGPTRSA